MMDAVKNGYGLRECSCCYNCTYADKGTSQLMLTCMNERAWDSPTAVEPLGGCLFWDLKNGVPYGKADTDGVDETRRDSGTM